MLSTDPLRPELSSPSFLTPDLIPVEACTSSPDRASEQAVSFRKFVNLGDRVVVDTFVICGVGQ